MTAGDARPLPCMAGEGHPLSGSSVLDSIMHWVQATPQAPALRYEERYLTYEELGRAVAATASVLADLRIGPGDLVALWADRTPRVVAAALAVMASRAGYVPLDPSYPEARVRTVLEAASPVALLFDGTSPTPPPQVSCPTADLEGLPPAVELHSTAAPRADDAAYVIFTSGSSGDPKGVVVEHGSLLNYVASCIELVGPAGTGAPLFASLGFDHAATCLWVPLVQGKCVALARGVWDQDALFGAREEPFTFLKLTPSHARFFERLPRPDYRTITDLLMFGGEALDPPLVAAIGDRLEGIRLVNHYGPTEATVGCCWHEFGPDEVEGGDPVPIGAPIWNSRAYVVDDALRAVAPGEAGELVMAGACVARGYLSGEQGGFIDERELGGGSGRAYRTGDVVERLPDGPLRYLGRRDSQLKIGGHRIELGEMRRHALALEAVGEVAFDVQRGDLDVVEAFVVPAGDGADGTALADDLRRALARNLPPPLVPQQVHVVNELVFDSHGKCDLEATRQALGGRSG